MTASKSSIFVSDVLAVTPECLREYGAFNASLINDLPLFIDPFLLFHSKKPEYQKIHLQMVDYLKFLRDKAVGGTLTRGDLESWFTFREVKQNWLGYSLNGNDGRGLGPKFAEALRVSLSTVLASFGSEDVSQGSHLEKVCLVSPGVGKDNISDFATNLIKEHLLQFTETFALKYLAPTQRRRIPVNKVRFNYATESWEADSFVLPYANNDFILLTPLDMLTKDEAWINRKDLVGEFSEVVASISNDQLRSQLNNYFQLRLNAILAEAQAEKAAIGSKVSRQRGPERSPDPTARQKEQAAEASIAAFPIVFDHFIRWKEDRGDEGEERASKHLSDSEKLYIGQVTDLVDTLRQRTAFYAVPGNTLAEARQRVAFLKDVIENKGGWRFFYDGDEPVGRETDVHIMFRLTWCNTPSDVNREVDNGRGPSDFEISRGRFDKTLVEFKLAKTSGLARNLQFQAEAYLKASDAQQALKVILYFTQAERKKVLNILEALHLTGHPDVIMIDARRDNKPSASKIRS